MPCINCYLSWAQEYAPALLVPLALWLVRFVHRLVPRRSSAPTRRPPTYGSPWWGPFRGLVAAYKLGVDEDAFLLSLLSDYGACVYLPWPLKQYFVVQGDAVQRVYDAPSKILSFVPIRKGMQHTAFGSPNSIAQSSVMESHIFPNHAKALQKSKLSPPLASFIASLSARLGSLAAEIDASGGQLQLPLVEWISNVMFLSAVSAMFGDRFFDTIDMTPSEFRTTFAAFDNAFPLLASGMIPPFLHSSIAPIRKGLEARGKLDAEFRKFIDAGLPGLDSGVIHEMWRISTEAGWPAEETARILTADCWAIQANAPWAAVWLVLYVLQAPGMVEEVLEEVANVDLEALDIAKTSTEMPVITSCLTETVRLSTSSFSIRDVEEDFFLPASPSSAAGGSNGKGKSAVDGCTIPAGSKIVCGTRVPHLSDWEGAREWDGKRFLGEEKAKRTREVRGFGGGISVCEGRSLAQAELKAFLALLLSSFDITILKPISASGGTPTSTTKINIKGGHEGISPTLAEGRTGMGVHQFSSDDVLVTVKRRAKVE